MKEKNPKAIYCNKHQIEIIFKIIFFKKKKQNFSPFIIAELISLLWMIQGQQGQQQLSQWINILKQWQQMWNI